MFECHKIYGNLLLLSVMMFALSVTACPVERAASSEAVCWQSRSFNGIRWENNTSVVIYRGQQIKAVSGSEMYLLVPDNDVEVVLHCVTEFDRKHNATYFYSKTVKIYASRAPPAMV